MLFLLRWHDHCGRIFPDAFCPIPPRLLKITRSFLDSCINVRFNWAAQDWTLKLGKGAEEETVWWSWINHTLREIRCESFTIHSTAVPRISAHCECLCGWQWGLSVEHGRVGTASCMFSGETGRFVAIMFTQGLDTCRRSNELTPFSWKEMRRQWKEDLVTPTVAKLCPGKCVWWYLGGVLYFQGMGSRSIYKMFLSLFRILLKLPDKNISCSQLFLQRGYGILSFSCIHFLFRPRQSTGAANASRSNSASPTFFLCTTTGT